MNHIGVLLIIGGQSSSNVCWMALLVIPFNVIDLVVFLHDLLFVDGYPLWEKKTSGYYLWAATLGEFNEDVKASIRSPAVQPMLVCTSEQNEKAPGGINFFLKLQSEARHKLIRGVKMFVTYLQKEAYVFSAFHGLHGINVV